MFTIIPRFGYFRKFKLRKITANFGRRRNNRKCGKALNIHKHYEFNKLIMLTGLVFLKKELKK